MIDREKALKALECLANNPFLDCSECPYNAPTLIPLKQRCDYRRICADALALLKEQEPRVMTLEEVLTAEDLVWAEIYTPQKWKWCVIYVKISPVVGNNEIVLIEEDCGTGWTKNKAEYGKRGFLDGGWRCWTSSPSPDQMRDTPWEGD